MPDSNIKKVDEELGRFLDKCLQRAHALAKGRLTNEAAAWWRSDYRARFFYAMVLKERKLKDVETEFLDHRLPDLVQKALNLAGTSMITPDHAARASVLHNCPPGSGQREEWCN